MRFKRYYLREDKYDIIISETNPKNYTRFNKHLIDDKNEESKILNNTDYYYVMDTTSNSPKSNYYIWKSYNNYNSDTPELIGYYDSNTNTLYDKYNTFVNSSSSSSQTQNNDRGDTTTKINYREKYNQFLKDRQDGKYIIKNVRKPTIEQWIYDNSDKYKGKLHQVNIGGTEFFFNGDTIVNYYNSRKKEFGKLRTREKKNTKNILDRIDSMTETQLFKNIFRLLLRNAYNFIDAKGNKSLTGIEEQFLEKAIGDKDLDFITRFVDFGKNVGIDRKFVDNFGGKRTNRIKQIRLSDKVTPKMVYDVTRLYDQLGEKRSILNNLSHNDFIINNTI